ncbi:MAG TPA: FABP family protein [Candidatus Dormibacteraeota bacterium]
MEIAELQAPFAAWLGRWEGEGRGLWASDPPFRYRETLAIEAVAGRPLLRLSQRTTDLGTGELSHSEVGFLRLLQEQKVELVVAVPAGYVEIHTGRLQGPVLALEPELVAASPAARPLRLVQRRMELAEGVLRSSLGIAVGSGPVQAHVAADLYPVTERTG